jgi:hypothetical protein
VLYRFFDWLSLVSKNSFTPSELALFPDIMQKRLISIAKDLPITEYGISLHVLYHLPSQIKRFGPLCESWCFGFERLIAFLKKGIQNKALPSASLMSYYILNIHLLTKYSAWAAELGPDDSEMDVQI